MKKGTLSTIILILIFCIGLSLLLYPTVSDWWNELHQSRAIAEYTENIANLDDDTYDKLWADAQSYNEALAQKADRYAITKEEHAIYESLLDVSGNGIIGYLEIPVIDCSLPIYHGTEEAVLQIAVGHVEGSSLPVGGKGTHCVLSGHRGLPSSKLFTNLDKLTEGDDFILKVLDETLTYKVDQILVVEPQDTEALQIEKDKDYCTLVTCTPYGINSHRMLVRGHRIENPGDADTVRVTADALQIEPMLVVPFVIAPMFLLLLIVILVSACRKRIVRRKAQ